jgi:hypothetical protein
MIAEEDSGGNRQKLANTELKAGGSTLTLGGKPGGA